MVDLFLNPQGRISPSEFWRGFVILTVVGTAIGAVATYLLPPIPAIVISLLSLLLIYPSLCLYGKRLHDAGKSAWYYLLVILVGIIAVAIGTSLVNGMVATELAADIQERIQEETQREEPSFAKIMEYSFELQRARFIPAAMIQLTVSIAIAYVVSILHSDPDENQYGPPPGAAASPSLA